MPKKKQPTAKQLAARAAASERLKKMHQEKKQNKQPVQANSDNGDIGELLRRIEELEAQKPSALQTPGFDNRGSLVGTFEKFNTDPNYYPNPIERLANEARVSRFGIKGGKIDDYSFELDFDVGLSAYETKDGRNVKEPKFILKLINVVYDEDTGEPTDKRYVSCQMIFHEDTGTALVVARENGVTVEDYGGEKQFLDEMRYLRMRDWLIDCFYPPAPAKATEKKEMVIGNRLVEVYTVNSEKSESMAGFFANGPKKL